MSTRRITIEVPAPLVRFSGRNATVSVEADTVREALAALHRGWPELGRRLLDDAGVPRKFLLLAVNGSELAVKDRLDTTLADGDRLTLLVPIAGG